MARPFTLARNGRSGQEPWPMLATPNTCTMGPLPRANGYCPCGIAPGAGFPIRPQTPASMIPQLGAQASAYVPLAFGLDRVV